MAAKKDKTVELLTPVCDHGKAQAVISDGDESFITEITRMSDGDPIEPGETMMTTEPIEGQPRKRRIIDQYTHEGPSRAATPKFRKNYDAMNWN